MLSVHFGLEGLFSKWRCDVPDLDAEDWEDAWEYPYLQLVSVKDRLIQFKILHRVYLTPQKFSKIYPDVSLCCYKCVGRDADFSHMLWSFWEEVMGFIATLTKIPIPLSVPICLLGLVDTLADHRATKTLLGLLLFYARKTLILKWKQP